jgi:hypothetical protein
LKSPALELRAHIQDTALPDPPPKPQTITIEDNEDSQSRFPKSSIEGSERFRIKSE